MLPWFFDDSDCRSAIYATQPKLPTYFDRDYMARGRQISAELRRALLWTGGYYFDVDMETVNPWIPNSTVAFATVTDPVLPGEPRPLQQVSRKVVFREAWKKCFILQTRRPSQRRYWTRYSGSGLLKLCNRQNGERKSLEEAEALELIRAHLTKGRAIAAATFETTIPQ
jgi:hypothetical protein